MSVQGISADSNNVQVIREWPKLKTLIEAPSFHDLEFSIGDSLKDSLLLPP